MTEHYAFFAYCSVGLKHSASYQARLGLGWKVGIA